MNTITTGNPKRDQMLLDAIASAGALGDAPTYESVVANLPENFELGRDEFVLFVPQPIDVEFSVVETPDGAPAEPPRDVPERPPTPAEIDEASNLVVTLTDGLATARVELNVAARKVQEAIVARQRAIGQFVAKHQPYSPLQQAKDFSRSEMATRQARNDGNAPMPARNIPGNSVVDRVAAYSRSNDAEGMGNFRRAVLMGGTGQPIMPASKLNTKLPSQR